MDASFPKTGVSGQESTQPTELVFYSTTGRYEVVLYFDYGGKLLGSRHQGVILGIRNQYNKLKKVLYLSQSSAAIRKSLGDYLKPNRQKTIDPIYPRPTLASGRCIQPYKRPYGLILVPVNAQGKQYVQQANSYTPQHSGTNL
ncbi:MAG: hypothetical protein ACFFCZ_24845 [Promethearchaeota archaeon]